MNSFRDIVDISITFYQQRILKSMNGRQRTCDSSGIHSMTYIKLGIDDRSTKPIGPWMPKLYRL
jgi:hypothetical protein